MIFKKMFPLRSAALTLDRSEERWELDHLDGDRRVHHGQLRQAPGTYETVKARFRPWFEPFLR